MRLSVYHIKPPLCQRAAGKVKYCYNNRKIKLLQTHPKAGNIKMCTGCTSLRKEGEYRKHMEVLEWKS